jgi:hypothetical protein
MQSVDLIRGAAMEQRGLLMLSDILQALYQGSTVQCRDA